MTTNVAALRMLIKKTKMDRGISGAVQVHLKCLDEDMAALENTMARVKAQQRRQVSSMRKLLQEKSVSVQ